jgi:hypothetical protein
VDKVLHLVVGIFLGLNPVVEPLDALAFTAIVAVAKEVYDNKHRQKHTPETRDALLTIAGGLIAFGYRKEF